MLNAPKQLVCLILAFAVVAQPCQGMIPQRANTTQNSFSLTALNQSALIAPLMAQWRADDLSPRGQVSRWAMRAAGFFIFTGIAQAQVDLYQENSFLADWGTFLGDILHTLGKTLSYFITAGGESYSPIGYALVISAAFWGLYGVIQQVRGWHRQQEFASSETGRNVIALMEAAQSKNLPAIVSLYRNVTQRHSSPSSNGQQAIALTETRRALVYDHFAKALASLYLNRLSSDIQVRIGQHRPKAWSEELKSQDSQASSTALEANLAFVLVRLAAEVELEQNQARYILTAIRYFGSISMGLLKGVMGRALKSGQKEAEIFMVNEIAQEAKLFETYNNRMRQRISDRRYAADPNFRQHRDRRDRLQQFYDELVHAALRCAQAIDDALSEAATQRALAASHHASAAALSAVPVYDAKGNFTGTRDDGGPYRALAMVASMQASQAESRAQRERQRLNPLLRAIQTSPLLAEFRSSSSPGDSRMSSVAQGLSPVMDMVLPDVVSQATSWFAFVQHLSSSDEISGVIKALTQLDHRVYGALQTEHRWLNTEIDKDLLAQMKQVNPLPAVARIPSLVPPLSEHQVNAQIDNRASRYEGIWSPRFSFSIGGILFFFTEMSAWLAERALGPDTVSESVPLIRNIIDVGWVFHPAQDPIMYLLLIGMVLPILLKIAKDIPPVRPWITMAVAGTISNLVSVLLRGGTNHWFILGPSLPLPSWATAFVPIGFAVNLADIFVFIGMMGFIIRFFVYKFQSESRLLSTGFENDNWLLAAS